MQSTVGIALLGCGTVGGGVAERLLHERDAIQRQTGVRYQLRGIAIRDPHKERPAGIPAELFTRDLQGLIADPQVDLVVECIGGTGEAADAVERALDRGRHLVTANKDLMATQGPRLRALAARRGVALRYEAAVAGAIPVVRALDESLAGEHVEAISGVVNGTCNAILSSMERGASYESALADAQERGYAEADPSSDVQGTDSAHKLAILIQLAFGLAVISPRIRRKGIDRVTADDVTVAAQLGYRIKLIASAARTTTGCRAEVAPLFVPEAHPFARVSGPINAVRIAARDAGELFFTGAGAGRNPSASAVLGDIVAALRAIAERHDLGSRARFAPAPDPAIDVVPAYDSFEHAARFTSLSDATAADRVLQNLGLTVDSNATRGSSARSDGNATRDGVPALRFRPNTRCSQEAIDSALSDAGVAPASVYPIWNDTLLDAPVTQEPLTPVLPG